MSIGRTRAVALIGLRGVIVEVEADIASGLPKFALVGMPDRALVEAADRVRSGIVNSGFAMPNQRVTVSLSPASLPKSGSGFDLAVAMAALAASGVVSGDAVASVVHIGELALDGRLRPTAGVLPAVLAAAQSGARAVIVPHANRTEAALVEGIEVISAVSLAHVVAWHGTDCELPEVDPIELADAGKSEIAGLLDLNEVVGQSDAVEALVVAAAGGHHMFMLGPPGAGKTMLASRLPGILPDLTTEQALEVACSRSLTPGEQVFELSVRPPFEAPHHSATIAALVGGGSGVIRPGAVARASHGVLFLDEAPEFHRATLDALRQPLESGTIVIARAAMSASFPARFQLILAANPCPCGRFGLPGNECACPSLSRRRYLERLSGPLRDRIDMTIRLPRVSPAQCTASGAASVSSAEAKSRVVAARARAGERWHSHGWQTNSTVPGSILRGGRWRLDAAQTRELDRAVNLGRLSMRGYDRVLRLAWTLADLDSQPRPTGEHIGRALQLRGGVFV